MGLRLMGGVAMIVWRSTVLLPLYLTAPLAEPPNTMILGHL
jgi:hypothetical protein